MKAPSFLFSSGAPSLLDSSADYGIKQMPPDFPAECLPILEKACQAHLESWLKQAQSQPGRKILLVGFGSFWQVQAALFCRLQPGRDHVGRVNASLEGRLSLAPAAHPVRWKVAAPELLGPPEDQAWSLDAVDSAQAQRYLEVLEEALPHPWLRRKTLLLVASLALALGLLAWLTWSSGEDFEQRERVRLQVQAGLACLERSPLDVARHSPEDYYPARTRQALLDLSGSLKRSGNAWKADLCTLLDPENQPAEGYLHAARGEVGTQPLPPEEAWLVVCLQEMRDSLEREWYQTTCKH